MLIAEDVPVVVPRSRRRRQLPITENGADIAEMISQLVELQIKRAGLGRVLSLIHI